MQKEKKEVDRDMQRRRFVNTAVRDVIDSETDRQIEELKVRRNVVEFKPEQIKIIKKRVLVA